MLYQTLPAIYEIFSKHSKPKDFPICQCCLSEDEKRDLLGRKLTELSADDLMSYASNVFLTVGSVPDFKYFLPRILDHSVNERFNWPDPEVVFGKLKLAAWTDWPQGENNAIIDLLNEKFTRLLENENTIGIEIDTWVCAMARCLPDVTPYLEPLLSEANETKLLSFIEWNWTAMSEGKLANAF
jgi:hypothetical protein